MDPYAPAEHHGVDCLSIDELPADDRDQAVVQHFLTTRQATWSVALVPLGSARIILENTSHTPQRRRVSVAHELGHFLLEHDFATALHTADGSRQFDTAQEKQADHFAGQLLVPDDDAVWASFHDFTNSDVADHFDVSEQFAGWRMVRARKIVQRYRAKTA
ncbi:MAG: ImmA/IrrE family metallo-endopeptidase [Pseudonocardiaceae bacterium]